MLKDIIRNKTTLFESLLSKTEFQNVLGQNGLLNQDEEEQFDEIYDNEIGVSDEEVADYIVENPNEVVVEFPIVSDVKLEEKLPFFRSVVFKLGGI